MIIDGFYLWLGNMESSLSKITITKHDKDMKTWIWKMEFIADVQSLTQWVKISGEENNWDG